MSSYQHIVWYSCEPQGTLKKPEITVPSGSERREQLGKTREGGKSFDEQGGIVPDWFVGQLSDYNCSAIHLFIFSIQAQIGG